MFSKNSRYYAVGALLVVLAMVLMNLPMAAFSAVPTTEPLPYGRYAGAGQVTVDSVAVSSEYPMYANIDGVLYQTSDSKTSADGSGQVNVVGDYSEYSTTIKDGGNNEGTGDRIFYILDEAGVWKIANNVSDWQEGVDESGEFWFQSAGQPRFDILIDEIVWDNSDSSCTGKMPYLFVRSSSAITAGEMANYYLADNDGNTYSPAWVDDSGDFFADLSTWSSGELDGTADELKLVWSNAAADTDTSAIATGYDVVVDRWEWGNQAVTVVGEDMLTYDNTIHPDYAGAMPTTDNGLKRTAVGVDTDDSSADLTVSAATACPSTGGDPGAATYLRVFRGPYAGEGGINDLVLQFYAPPDISLLDHYNLYYDIDINNGFQYSNVVEITDGVGFTSCGTNLCKETYVWVGAGTGANNLYFRINATGSLGQNGAYENHEGTNTGYKTLRKIWYSDSTTDYTWLAVPMNFGFSDGFLPVVPTFLGEPFTKTLAASLNYSITGSQDSNCNTGGTDPGAIMRIQRRWTPNQGLTTWNCPTISGAPTANGFPLKQTADPDGPGPEPTHTYAGSGLIVTTHHSAYGAWWYPIVGSHNNTNTMRIDVSGTTDLTWASIPFHGVAGWQNGTTPTGADMSAMKYLRDIAASINYTDTSSTDLRCNVGGGAAGSAVARVQRRYDVNQGLQTWNCPTVPGAPTATGFPILFHQGDLPAHIRMHTAGWMYVITNTENRGYVDWEGPHYFQDEAHLAWQ